MHAAGVIMSSDPLIDIVPMMKREQDGAIITQFDYPMCEALGLLKMDFLGLRNLTVLDDCLDNIKVNRAPELVLEDLAVDDDADLRAAVARATPSACSSSTAARCGPCCAACGRTSSRTSPRSVALYRPGPMGADAHNEYADRKNGTQAGRADPPRAGRAAGRRSSTRPMA